MPDEAGSTPANGAAAPQTPPAAPDASAEAARLFGAGDGAAPGTGHPGMPEGYIEKYWNAAKGDAAEYARHLSQGYTHLNAQFTQATQGAAEDPRGDSADAYFAGQDPKQWAEKYDRLSFDDPEAIRDIYRAAHETGLGPKRTQAMVDAYLQRRQSGAPEVESDESRRSRVIHELGPQGAAMAHAVATFMQGHARAGTLTGTEMAALAPVAETPDGIRALFKMSRSSMTRLPDGQGAAGLEAARQKEMADLKEALADPKRALLPETAARYKALVRDGYTLDGERVPAVP